MNFFGEFITRLQVQSPKFFIILRYASAILAGLSLLMQKVLADELWLPSYADKVETVCGYFITAAIAIWGTSFLPSKEPIKKDNSDINKPETN
jgi:hypothetical protein